MCDAKRHLPQGASARKSLFHRLCRGTIIPRSSLLVRTAGIEPARASPRDFKSLASTSFATSARRDFNIVTEYEMEGPLAGKMSFGQLQPLRDSLNAQHCRCPRSAQAPGFTPAWHPRRAYLPQNGTELWKFTDRSPRPLTSVEPNGPPLQPSLAAGCCSPPAWPRHGLARGYFSIPRRRPASLPAGRRQASRKPREQ
jgi:hypothetical protein